MIGNSGSGTGAWGMAASFLKSGLDSVERVERTVDCEAGDGSGLDRIETYRLATLQEWKRDVGRREGVNIRVEIWSTERPMALLRVVGSWWDRCQRGRARLRMAFFYRDDIAILVRIAIV